jgi:hypothetical protein
MSYVRFSNSAHGIRGFAAASSSPRPARGGAGVGSGGRDGAAAAELSTGTLVALDFGAALGPAFVSCECFARGLGARTTRGRNGCAGASAPLYRFNGTAEGRRGS